MVNSIFGAGWVDSNIGFFAGSPFNLLGSNSNNSTDTVEAESQRIVRAGGTISLLTCNVTVNAQSSTSNLKLRNQSGNMNSVCAIPATTVGIVQDTTHSDTQVSGDKLDIQATFPGAANFTVGLISMKWAATTGGSQFFTAWCDSGSGWVASTSYYQALSGRFTSGTTTETDTQTLIRAGGTLSNMAIYIASNSNASAVAMTGRINAADGNQTISIGAAATGYMEDTTHTDTVTAGQFINTKLAIGSGTVTWHPTFSAMMIVVSGVLYDIFTNNRGVILSSAADQYLQPIAQITQTTTELQAQIKYPFGETISRMRLNVTAAGVGVSIISRVNGANGNQSITFSGTGWLEDTTHTDTLASGDLFCAKLLHGGSNPNAQAMAFTGGVTAINGSGSPTQAAAAPVAHAVSPTHAGSGTLTQAAGAGAAHAMSSGPSPTLHQAAAHAIGGDLEHRNGTISQAASIAIANAVSFYATPIAYFPGVRIMRNTPVPGVGAMDNNPVAGIGRMYVCGPQPVSREVTLAGVATIGAVAGLQTRDLPTNVLTGAAAIGFAGTLTTTSV